MKNNLVSACKDTFNKFSPSEYEYFLFHHALGDAMGFFYWLKEYKKKHDKKILLFCFRDVLIEFMNICPYVDEVLKIDIVTFDFISIYFSERYGIRDFYTLHMNPDVLKVQNLFPQCIRSFGPLIKPRDFLGINPEIKFKKYKVDIPAEKILKAKKIFNELGLIRGKTVFFVTEGVSANKPHYKNFFIKLAEILMNHGYEIITNGKKESIPGCKNIFLSLLETSVFVGLCGNVVSITTGFNEVICALNSTDKIKLSVIMPGKNDIDLKQPVTNWQQVEYISYAGRKRADISIKNYEYFLSLCLSKNINYKLYQRGGGFNNGRRRYFD